MRPLVDKQLAKPKRGTCSQCGVQDADRFVVIAGNTEIVRELQRRAKVCTGAVVLIDVIAARASASTGFLDGRRCPLDLARVRRRVGRENRRRGVAFSPPT